MILESVERLRAVPRLLHIARTLGHYGMSDFVHSVGLHRVLEEAGHVLGGSRDPELAELPLTERVPLVLEALGPAFVKLGQVLASRVDLLGDEWIHSLDRLHDRASPLPFEVLEQQLVADLGMPIEQAFTSFDRTPAASGSIAQVHRAVLPDGKAVALKIRRPGVVAAVESDLLLLETIAQWWEEEDPQAKRMQPVAFVRQLRKSLTRELDFAAEARGQEKFCESFSESVEIVVPRVHARFTRPTLLVMDWVEGIRCTNLEAVDAAGLDRHALAARGSDAVLKMVLVDGFFHADPHPGNVIFLAGNRLAFIDFGMVGWISEARRDELVDLLAASAARDASGMRDVLLSWADGHSLDADAFAEDLARLVHLYEHVALQNVRLGTLLADLAGVMREHHLLLPPDLALLFKALITLEGFATRLEPKFRLDDHVRPQVRALLHARWEPRALAQRFSRVAREAGRALNAAPRFFEALSRQLGREGMALRLELRELAEFSRQMERSVNRLTIGLVTAALIVGSSILVASSERESTFAWVLGVIGVTVSFLNSLWLIWTIRRSGKH